MLRRTLMMVVIYTRILFATIGNKQLILFYWELWDKSCDGIIWYFLATCVYQNIVNLFRAWLMVICKESHLKTLVSVNRYKCKPLYDTLFWEARRPGEFGEIHWKFVGGICVWSFVGPQLFPLANHRAGNYQTKTPREGWHHSESLQQVSWP